MDPRVGLEFHIHATFIELQGKFGNALESPQLQQFYYLEAEHQTTDSSTYSPNGLCTLLPSAWELPDGSTVPFFRGVVIPVMDSRLLASGWLYSTIL